MSGDMTAAGTGEVCNCTCDHVPQRGMRRQEHALLSEGICPDCKVAAEHDAEGFAVCPCCLTGWVLRDSFVLARLPFVLVDDEEYHDGASGGGTDG